MLRNFFILFLGQLAFSTPANSAVFRIDSGRFVVPEFSLERKSESRFLATGFVIVEDVGRVPFSVVVDHHNDDFWQGHGSIRTEFRAQKNGPVLFSCDYPLYFSFTVIRTGIVFVELKTAKMVPSIATKCSEDEVFSKMTESHGPKTFKMKN